MGSHLVMKRELRRKKRLTTGMNGAAFFCFGAGRGGAGTKIHGAGHFRGGACQGVAWRGKQYVNAEVNVLGNLSKTF